jgi:hypothetical protein
VEAINFEAETYYQLEDKEESEKIRQSLINNYEAIKLAKKAKKAEVSKSKKVKKEEEDVE